MSQVSPDDIDTGFSELRGKVAPNWYAALLPLVRTRYRGASTKEIDAATIEACLWADPLTRLAMREASRMKDEIDRWAKFDDSSPNESYENWKLKHTINDAMKGMPDDFSEA